MFADYGRYLDAGDFDAVRGALRRRVRKAGSFGAPRSAQVRCNRSGNARLSVGLAVQRPRMKESRHGVAIFYQVFCSPRPRPSSGR